MEKKNSSLISTKWIWEDPWSTGRNLWDGSYTWDYIYPYSLLTPLNLDGFQFATTYKKVEKGYEITVSSPGVKKEFIKIELESDGVLAITYLADQTKVRMEQKKLFVVPETEQIEATYEDGLLTVTAKNKEKVKKLITVK